MATPLFCAVIGNPIAHSRSPEIHHAFARETGLAVQYERILASSNDFRDHVLGFFAQGGVGLNVTVPFKEDAFALAAIKSPRAEMAGAVNTLWMQEGQLHGCNTDGIGLVRDLERLGFAPKDKKILLLGAGGATKGVLLPLLEAGAQHIRIINRSPDKAHALVQQFTNWQPDMAAKLSAGALKETEGEWDIVINATSSSLQQTSPIQSPIHFTPKALAYDMVYGAKPSPFLIEAAQQGAHFCADGLGMLVEQAAQSFAIWHHRQPEVLPVLTQLRAQLSA